VNAQSPLDFGPHTTKTAGTQKKKRDYGCHIDDLLPPMPLRIYGGKGRTPAARMDGVGALAHVPVALSSSCEATSLGMIVASLHCCSVAILEHGRLATRWPRLVFASREA
jgi:hypothetical protein